VFPELVIDVVGGQTHSKSLLAVPALAGLGVGLVTIGVVVVTANDRRGDSVRRPRDANN